jgi:hypothetical protein
MRGGARGASTSYTPPHETMAAASSRPNYEALATRVVLAHPCAAFYPCRCGLRGGAAAVAATLISYDDIEVAVKMTMKRR